MKKYLCETTCYFMERIFTATEEYEFPDNVKPPHHFKSLEEKRGPGRPPADPKDKE